MPTNARRSQVCHEHCLDVHAIPAAIENFAEARFDPYANDSLGLFAARRVVRWDTVEPTDNWEDFEAMIEDVAIDYLLDGTVECSRY